MKLFTFILITILTGIELDLFIPSFPEIQHFFNLSTFETQLTLSVNFVSYCLGGVFIGWIGDHYSRKKILLSGLCLFVVGSIFCVFPCNYYILLIGRAFQGFGIAAPSVLIPVLISDSYSEERQVELFGIIHGVCAITMSIAPIIGSYITLFFSWRGNFASLLICGSACLLLATISIEASKNTTERSSFASAYARCLKSRNFWLIGIVVTFATAPYWIFIGMAPFLYMERMSVSLEHFGIYQGSLALAFGVPSILSSFFLNRFGYNKCFHFSWISGIMTCILLIVDGFIESYNPIILTIAYIPFSIGVAFLFNMLFPAAMAFHKKDRSKIIALLLAMRLFVCAFFLQLVGYYGHDSIFPTTTTITGCMIFSFLFIIVLVRFIPAVTKGPITAHSG